MHMKKDTVERELMQKLGTRVANLREEAGLNQVQLGEVIGMSLSSVSAIERGVRGCSYKTLINLSNYFNVTIDYIVSGHEEAEDYVVRNIIFHHNMESKYIKELKAKKII